MREPQTWPRAERYLVTPHRAKVLPHDEVTRYEHGIRAQHYPEAAPILLCYECLSTNHGYRNAKIENKKKKKQECV